MRAGLNYRTELGRIAFLIDELDNIIAKVRGAWSVEHSESDGHTNITADSVTVSLDNPGATGTVTAAAVICDNLAVGVDIYQRGSGTPMGTATDIAFDAANFTAQTGNWTVDAGDVGTNRYTMIGQTMVLNVDIITSSTSAATSYLRYTLPGGYTFAANVSIPYQVFDGTTRKIGIAVGAVGTPWLQFYSDPSATAWPIVANNISLAGLFVMEMAR